MAVSEFELHKWKSEMERFLQRKRPPPHLRAQVDLAYRIEGQSIEIFEIRPRFHDPNTLCEQPVAKATFVKSRRSWRIYWMRADLKWHAYRPVPEVSRLGDFLAQVEKDEYACFYG